MPRSIRTSDWSESAFTGRRPSRRRLAGARIVLSVGAASIAACAPTVDRAFEPTARLAHSTNTEREPDQPVVLVGDSAVTLRDLRPALIELAGAAALEEVALSRLLRQEIARRQITLPGGAIESERDAILSRLAGSRESPSSDRAAGLLAQLRARRGLGPHRFAALLERNAMLRAIVRSDPELVSEPSEDDVRAAYAIKHGPRVLARIIVVSSAVDAARVRERLAVEPFEAVAGEESLDATAAQGGLFGPVSVDDPAYPVAVRNALRQLQPGELSAPVAVTWPDPVGGARSGYALIRLERSMPADTDADAGPQARDQLRGEIRAVRERAAMERLARDLLATNPLRILDRDLADAWAVPGR